MSSTHHTSLNDFPVRRHRLTPRVAVASLILLLAGLAMIAAAIIVIVGEKSGAVSLPLWTGARIACQVITGLIGVAMLVVPVITRGSDWSRKEMVSSVAWGGCMVAAAVIPVGFVIAVTGTVGLGLTVAGANTAARDYVGSASPTK